MDSGTGIGMTDLLNFETLVRMSPTNVWFLRLTKFAFKLLAPADDDAVCDVGCGAGERILLLSSYVRKATGLDISAPLIEFLSEKTKGDNASFHVVNATAEPPPEFISAYDKCLCMDMLEHVEEPAQVLGFISKILKPGGYAVIGLPINTDYEQHHRHFDAGGVSRLAGDSDMETRVLLLKLSPLGRLIDRTFTLIRNVLSPPRAGDCFHESMAYKMLTEPKKIHGLYKLVIVLLFKMSQDSYHETYRQDKAARRAFILAKKKDG